MYSVHKHSNRGLATSLNWLYYNFGPSRTLLVNIMHTMMTDAKYGNSYSLSIELMINFTTPCVRDWSRTHHCAMISCLIIPAFIWEIQWKTHGGSRLIWKHCDFPSNANCDDVDDVKWGMCLFLTVASQWEARISTQHGTTTDSSLTWDNDRFFNPMITGQG